MKTELPDARTDDNEINDSKRLYRCQDNLIKGNDALVTEIP